MDVFAKRYKTFGYPFYGTVIDAAVGSADRISQEWGF